MSRPSRFTAAEIAAIRAAFADWRRLIDSARDLRWHLLDSYGLTERELYRYGSGEIWKRPRVTSEAKA